MSGEVSRDPEPSKQFAGNMPFRSIPPPPPNLPSRGRGGGSRYQHSKIPSALAAQRLTRLTNDGVRGCVAVTESHEGRALQEYDIGNVIPGPGVTNEGLAVFAGVEGPQL